MDACFDPKIGLEKEGRVQVVFEDDKDEDDMTMFLWDGPEDSDEEVECLIPLKTDHEIA